MPNRTQVSHIRNSNFELMRIISMLMIITHHFVVHGLMRYECSRTTYLVSQIFYPLGKIGFVAFIALSMWFIVDSRFKSDKFFRYYLETLFYTLILGICTYFLTDQNYTVWTWVSLFFPIIGNSHNFISTYLVFYLLSPFLKIIADKVNKNQLIILVGILFLVQVVASTLMGVFNVNHLFSSSIILFIFLYFLILFLKRFPIKLLNCKPILLLTFIIMWMLMYCINTQYIALPDNPILKNFVNSLLFDEGSIMNLLAGLSVFFLFSFKKAHHSKVINFIATPTLGILLIHDAQLFKYYFWSNVVHVNNFANSGPLILLIIIGMSILIYLVTGSIDTIRKYAIENQIFKLKPIQNACLKINQVMNVDNNK